MQEANREPVSQSERRGRGSGRFGARLRLVLRLSVWLSALAVIVFVIGFVGFARDIAATTTPASASGDGIVVLTGGAKRLTAAITLLEDGHGKRLLISGVHPKTSLQDLLDREAGDGRLSCCIDVDHAARDTIGNALQTTKWIAEHGFSSVIVVTSAYHMPRSLIELSRRLPDTEVVPYPVVREDLHLDRWYRHGGTIRLLLAEYVKYILARVRLAASMPEL